MDVFMNSETAIKNFLNWARANAPEFYTRLMQRMQQEHIPSPSLSGLDGWETIATTIANLAATVVSGIESVKSANSQKALIQAQIDALRASQQQASVPAIFPGLPSIAAQSSSAHSTTLMIGGIVALGALYMVRRK
jgi:hypothetical protein